MPLGCTAIGFDPNPPAYDPHYHYQLAIEVGLNAYAAQMAALMGANIIKVKPPTAVRRRKRATREDRRLDAG